jgi:iron complex outermembrane receptor protein
MRQNYAWQATNNKTTTHTLDLTGRAELAGMRHELLIGLEHSEEERQPQVYGTVPGPTIDPFNPVWPARPAQRPDPTQNNLHEAASRALYVQDFVHLAPQWKLLVGARYDSYDFDTLNRLTGTTRAASGSSVSPRAGLVWQPVREHSVYTSYSKSYSPYGGRGMLGVSGAQDDEPRYSRQVEAGIKSDWLDGGLSTQLAAYQLEHYNIRYQPDAVNSPLEWAVRGKERSRGIEFSLAGRVAPSWYVRGGVGLMSAKVAAQRQPLPALRAAGPVVWRDRRHAHQRALQQRRQYRPRTWLHPLGRAGGLARRALDGHARHFQPAGQGILALQLHARRAAQRAGERELPVLMAADGRHGAATQ